MKGHHHSHVRLIDKTLILYFDDDVIIIIHRVPSYNIYYQ